MKTRKVLMLFIALSIAFLSYVPNPAFALSMPLTMVPDGTIGSSLVYRADLTGILGLTQIGTITIVDDGTPVGGSPGIFSGFDVDAVFLDVDGNLASPGDTYFASSYLFAAGSTRTTSDPTMLPNATHPGPTFGSLNSSSIDLATATLSSLNGVAVAHVNVADGFLTLGDGGTLVANFAPGVPVVSTLFLMVGEVGGQAGEGLGATVTVSSQSVPEPSTMLLLGSGLLGLVGLNRRRKA